ncbi:MAG: hydroxymethylglutaryl-CoA lyase [Bacteroidia bacterium]|nr:hydroxymethylglutaryl-CoA lyase [Bacteroidia bacterium]
MDKVYLTECPRDAMQGIKEFIPTETKINYLNLLLKCGFDILDFGSFVSPKAIPQLQDTAEVLDSLDLSNSNTELLSIVLNERGAKDALQYSEISYLGLPFSISETFQQRNGNSSIEENLQRLEQIQNLAVKANRNLLVYISMAFGNPYGDPWNTEIALQWTERISKMGIEYISLADTIGSSTPESISYMFKALIPAFPKVKFGAHLHTTPDKWEEKVEAAYNNGVRRFDGALKGFGGCPMASDKLTGNMPTENLYSWINNHDSVYWLDPSAFGEAMAVANEIFTQYH